jgi:hypothetical protein
MSLVINTLPENLIREARDLRHIGIAEFAWEYDFILDVMRILNENDYVILGGDVYKIDEESEIISSTGDNWYFNKSHSEHDVIEGYKEAKEYVSNYEHRNGNCFCYSIVCEKHSRV